MKPWRIFTFAIAGFLIFTGTTYAAFFDFFREPKNEVQLIQIVGDIADLQADLESRVFALEELNVLGNFRLGAGSTVETIEQFRATTSPYSAIGTRIHAKNIYAPYSHATTSALTATNIYGTGSSTINVLNVNTCNGCPGASGVSGSGSANRLAYWDGASSISSDADFTINAATGNLTATYASTTFITATYGSTTALSVSGSFAITPLTSALLLTGADGTLAEYAGTSCTNQFPRSLSALGAATCATVVDADVDDGITLTNITQITNRDITSLTTAAGAGAVYFSSGAVPAVDATNLSFNDTLNRLTFTYGTTTFLTATYATTTAVSVSGSFAVTPLTSAITLTGADGTFAEYAGATCTNQFVRALSALGAATCATVVAGDVDLADLTATDATLTLSGAYDGQIARTIGLTLSTANLWTASSTFPMLNVNSGLFGSTTIQTLNVNSCNGCSGAVAGADTQVIFNDGGNYAGNAGLVFNKTLTKLTYTYGSTTALTATYASTTALSANNTTVSASSTLAGISYTGGLYGLAQGGGFIARFEENSGGEFMELQLNSAGDLNFIQDDGATALIVYDVSPDANTTDPIGVNGISGIGDADTLIDFDTNAFQFYAGGIQFVDFQQPAGQDFTVFNEDGVDVDFRVESLDNPNMLFVDGALNRFGIATATPLSTLSIYGSTTIQTWQNVPLAFQILNAATSSIFAVDTVNSSSTFSGLVNANKALLGSTTAQTLNVNTLLGTPVTIPVPLGSSTARVERLLFKMPYAVIVNNVDGQVTCYGNACKAGLTFNIMHGTTLDNRVNLFAGTLNVASTSAGTTITTFNDNTIASGEYLWHVPTQASTTLNDAAITINATRVP